MSSFTASDGVRLHVLVVGREEDPTAVLVPALAGSIEPSWVGP